MILDFQISDEDLAKWTDTIYRLFPNSNSDVIGKITDNFLTGEEDFEKEKGILNYTLLIPRYLGF